MDKSFATEGYRLSKSGNFCIGKLSCIYDITNKTVIDCFLTNNENERAIFLEKLKYIPTNSIIVFDRGYYSAKLFEFLNTPEKI
jgi:hypothetical protein